jgi:tRNA threonylcarbamoyladenosine biosynthesis protein TsaE
MQTRQYHFLDSPEATRVFAQNLAPSLPRSTVIALYGDLGAGKTTLMQGLAQGLGGEEAMVQSPTFTYLHSYPTKIPLYHFDLYRLTSSDDFLAMGFEETFEKDAIVAIEWPERIASLLTFPHLEIRLTHVSEQGRNLVMQWI